MIRPSTEQIELFKVYLRKCLRYRETYEEVFDHVMSALAEQPGTLSFEEAINAVIQRDFGGANGLTTLEKTLAKKATNTAIRQQWGNVKESFSIRKLPYLACLGLTCVLALTYIPFSPVLLTAILIVGMIVPGLFVIARYFYIGYYYNDRKASIRDRITGLIAGRPSFALNALFILIVTLKHKIDINAWVQQHIPVCALLITLFCIYVFAFAKFVRSEIPFRLRH